jgi:hypothetical protein
MWYVEHNSIRNYVAVVCRLFLIGDQYYARTLVLEGEDTCSLFKEVIELSHITLFLLIVIEISVW